jgi:hypothetical protein
VAIGGKPHFEYSVELELFDVVASFAYHIRLPHGFLHKNLSFQEEFQLGTFLLWTDLCAVAIGDNPHYQFFDQAVVF